MHRHDLDLIAEYAGGDLADVSVARSLVESCPTCADEYRRQRSVIDSLSAAGMAPMTDHEKAALHRDVWTELRAPTASPQPVAGVRRWQSWAFGAAAVVFIAVGLLGVLEGLNRDGAVTETFSEIGSALDGDGSAAGGQADGGGESEDGMDPAEAPRALSDLYSDTPYAQIARQVRGETVTTTSATSDEASDSEQCLESAGLVGHEVVEGFESLTDLVIAVPVESDIATAPVSFVDAQTCTVVHVEE